jgi:16S rRNA (cytidine1402-2'-O)-methyltransferase
VRLRGEIVLVIAGAPEAGATASDAVAVVSTLRRSGLSASQAAREAAAITGLPRSDLYRIALQVKVNESAGLKGELALPDEDALEDALGNKERPE